MRRLIGLAVAAALLGASAAAQDTTQTTTPAAPAAPTGPAAPAATPEKKPAVPEPEPLPYSSEEFAPWLRDLRRGEIIAIGAFPIIYVFTQLGYNLYRFGVHGWDAEYAPVGNPNRAPYSENETIGVLLGAASASILLATVDYLIGRWRRNADGKP
jgi:hypothetical protein